MTEGRILPLLVRYTVPLLAGNLFQQLYNTVDSIVVGNFAGKEALAAIGTTSALTMLVVGFFNGFYTGCTTVIARYFGARNFDLLKKAVHSIVAGTFLFGTILSGVAVLLSPLMLQVLGIPGEVFGQALVYMQIYFGGIIFLLLYNMGAAVLRAMGDSRRPFYFLIASTIVNIVLDIVFVLVFHWGVKGVAVGTVIAEAVSALLILVVMFRTDELYKVELSKLKIDSFTFGQILKLGFPTAVQMSVTAISNVFVQKYVNYFGADAMAGWAIFQKMDTVIFLPVASVGMASQTFAGQNFGADNIPRLRQGTKVAIRLNECISVTLGFTLFVFAPFIVGLFNRDPGVVHYGTYVIRVSSAACIIRGWNQVFGGALRGMGEAKMPMFIILFSFVVLRQIYLAVAMALTRSFYWVGAAFAFGWFFGNVLCALYYAWFMKKHYGQPVPLKI